MMPQPRHRTPITVHELIDQFGEPSAAMIIRAAIASGVYDFDVIASRRHPAYREFTLVFEMEIDEWPVIYL
jgi:hypothetical protein